MNKTKPIKVIFFDLGDTLVTADRKWISGAPEILHQLKEGGIRLGVISNTGTLPRAQVLEQLPQNFDLQLFETKLVLFSSETTIEKPSPAIFNLAVTKSGVAANECLFCTENLLHTLAAQAVGMRAARLLPPPGGDLLSLLDTLKAYKALI